MRLTAILTFVMFSLFFAACNNNQQQTSTPTATINAYTEAMRKNDVTAMRQHLSKGTLETINQAALEQKITPDEVLSSMSKQANAANQSAAPETRNEQIAGDAATLEIKNSVTGGWDRIPFTKEDGRWKIALDKLVEEALREADLPDMDDNHEQNSNSAAENSANRQSNKQSNK